MSTETYNIASIIIYSFSAIIALIMLGVAISQLGNLTEQIKETVKANKISGLGTFLEVESQLNSSRIELAKASINIIELQKTGSQDEISSASLYFNQCVEMYLNSIDRLCFCIIKEYFDNDEMKLHVIKTALIISLSLLLSGCDDKEEITYRIPIPEYVSNANTALQNRYISQFDDKYKCRPADVDGLWLVACSREKIMKAMN
ncbi:hypothetical protein KGP17_12750 [Serratia sp. JSRIV001]|uniref:hypothetical protein n=1 Tax=Serratia sp. JSRIV001 TaxID=2831893 RepID=UPI001CBAC22C|nr:hypothetical protein [Serratia sp. JSRIV001]UAN48329.1 hypothetical protein KGP17_12750 [Serratia sp. JSRIV001]